MQLPHDVSCVLCNFFVAQPMENEVIKMTISVRSLEHCSGHRDPKLGRFYTRAAHVPQGG